MSVQALLSTKCMFGNVRFFLGAHHVGGGRYVFTGFDLGSGRVRYNIMAES